MRACVLGFAAANLVLQRGSAATCSRKQQQCVEDVWEQGKAIITKGNRCVVGPLVFGQAAACLSGACTGYDLGYLQEECSSRAAQASTTCNLDCSGIALFQASGEPENPEASSYPQDAATPSATDFQSDFSTLEAPLGEGFKVQWTGQVPEDLQGAQTGSPVALGSNGTFGVAIAGPDSKVRAYGHDSQLLWEFESPASGQSGAVFRSQPVTAGSVNSNATIEDLVVGDTSGFLYRLDGASGVLLNKWDLGSALVSSAAVANDYAFAISKGQAGFPPILHKLALSSESSDNKTSSKAWRTPVCANHPLSVDWVPQGLSLTSDGGVILACQWTGVVERVDGATGQQEWAFDVAESNLEATYDAPMIVAAPRIVNDTILVTASDALYRLAAATGEQLWSVKGIKSVANRTVAGPMTADEHLGVVYWVDDEGLLDVVSLQTGATQQQISIAPSDGPWACSVFGLQPLLDANGQLVIPARSDLIFLDSFKSWRTNSSESTSVETIARTRHRVQLGSKLTSSPILSNGIIYTSTAAAALTQVSATSLPSVSPTQAPSRVTQSESPTMAPTLKNETDGQDPNRVTDTDPEVKDDKWPHSAIITVSTLAAFDVLLAGVLAFRKVRSSRVDSPRTAETDVDSGLLAENGDKVEHPSEVAAA